MKDNPFKEGKNYVIFYRNQFHKVWTAFDFLEAVNECKDVLKQSSYFKIWKLIDDKYVVLTTKKRVSDKIVRELAKKIVASPYKEMLTKSITEFRQKIEKDLEKKNAL